MFQVCSNTFSGEALDLFYRFGFFSLSMRVVPRDDSGAWLVREPTEPIFEQERFTVPTFYYIY